MCVYVSMYKIHCGTKQPAHELLAQLADCKHGDRLRRGTLCNFGSSQVQLVHGTASAGDRLHVMLRIHVRLRKEGQEAETILVPTEPTKRVHDFKVEVARRVQKLAAFEGCRVICLREGSRALALIDDEDLVSDVLENGDTVLAEVAWPPSAAGVEAAPAQPDKGHEVMVGSASDTGETTDGSGAEVEPAELETGYVAASVRYQTLERLARGLPPQVVEAP